MDQDFYAKNCQPDQDFYSKIAKGSFTFYVDRKSRFFDPSLPVDKHRHFANPSFCLRRHLPKRIPPQYHVVWLQTTSWFQSTIKKLYFAYYSNVLLFQGNLDGASGTVYILRSGNFLSLSSLLRRALDFDQIFIKKPILRL